MLKRIALPILRCVLLLPFVCWAGSPSALGGGLPAGLLSPFEAPPASTVRLSNGLSIDSSGNLLINASLSGGAKPASSGFTFDSSGNLMVNCSVGCISSGSSFNPGYPSTASTTGALVTTSRFIDAATPTYVNSADCGAWLNASIIAAITLGMDVDARGVDTGVDDPCVTNPFAGNGKNYLGAIWMPVSTFHLQSPNASWTIPSKTVMLGDGATTWQSNGNGSGGAKSGTIWNLCNAAIDSLNATYQTACLSSGTATIGAGGVVTWNSGSTFLEQWVQQPEYNSTNANCSAGTTSCGQFVLNGTSQTVQSVQSATQLTLTTSPATGGPYAFNIENTFLPTMPQPTGMPTCEDGNSNAAPCPAVVWQGNTPNYTSDFLGLSTTNQFDTRIQDATVDVNYLPNAVGLQNGNPNMAAYVSAGNNAAAGNCTTNTNCAVFGTVSTQNAASGSCTADCVQWVSGVQFSAGWTGTFRINVAGVPTNFTISSVKSATLLQLTTAPGSNSGVGYGFDGAATQSVCSNLHCAAQENSGYLLSRVTNPTGNVGQNTYATVTTTNSAVGSCPADCMVWMGGSVFSPSMGAVSGVSTSSNSALTVGTQSNGNPMQSCTAPCLERSSGAAFQPWMAYSVGLVTNSGGTLTWVHGDQFNTAMTGTIIVNHLTCTISSVSSATSMVVSGTGCTTTFATAQPYGISEGTISVSISGTYTACLIASVNGPDLLTLVNNSCAGANPSTNGTAYRIGGLVETAGTQFTITTVNDPQTATLSAAPGTQSLVQLVINGLGSTGINVNGAPHSFYEKMNIDTESGPSGATYTCAPSSTAFREVSVATNIRVPNNLNNLTSTLENGCDAFNGTNDDGMTSVHWSGFGPSQIDHVHSEDLVAIGVSDDFFTTGLKVSQVDGGNKATLWVSTANNSNAVSIEDLNNNSSVIPLLDDFETNAQCTQASQTELPYYAQWGETGTAKARGYTTLENDQCISPWGMMALTTNPTTCGGGGTISPCTGGSIVPGLSKTLYGGNWTYLCRGSYSQATAAAANQFGVITQSNAPTGLYAEEVVYTAAGTVSSSAIEGVSSTSNNTFTAFTPGATGTVLPFEIKGRIIGASSSGTNFSLTVLSGSSSDTLSIYGASCVLRQN